MIKNGVSPKLQKGKIDEQERIYPGGDTDAGYFAVKYKLRAEDRGKLLDTFIQERGSDKILTKTVYDSSKFSDEKLCKMAQEAVQKWLDENGYDIVVKRRDWRTEFIFSGDNQKYVMEGYLNPDGKINTFYFLIN